MIIISAMSKDRIIGSGDGMPWDVSEEYAQFLAFIKGQAVIMGRKSFEIFGKDMQATEMFVVSRSVEDMDGAVVCGSIEEAVQKAEATGKTVFSAGGGRIYEQTISLADTMYLSFIKGDYTGDTKFPEFDEQKWQVEKREDHPAFEFVVYKRIER